MLRVEEKGAFVGLVSEADLESAPLAARDERQAREYVSGVTRWKRWLDFILGEFVKGNLENLEPPLRQVLRIGVYDLLMLDTPPHAAVNEAVELTRSMVRPQAARLTNGVLRNVVRAMDALPEPATADEAERLAILNSHPTWMVRRWIGRYGRDATIDLLQANNSRPKFGLRVDQHRVTVEQYEEMLTALGVDHERSPYLDDFLRVSQLQSVLAEGHLKEGLVAVQDESAGMVVRVLDPRPGDRILDLCAAPGGKAIYAVERMQDEGELLAVDIHEGRLRLLKHAARAHGFKSIRTLAADGRTLDLADVGTFDRVLLDAPCSGLGVLSRRADLRWNRRERDIADLTRLQDELLHGASALVRPGGLLVYSSCTIEPEENEDRVEAFLANHPEFQAERADDLVPADVLDSNGRLLTLPHVHGVDGAFAARLRKTGE